jgi:2-phosphosulfolactate phosphatase
MTIEVCYSPLLYPAYHDPEQVVVVVDIFRATTSIVTAFMNGAKLIRPVADTEEAERYKALGWLAGAERNVQKCSFADFGNSPFDYTPDKVGGRRIAFTTTNGTKAISIARHAHSLITGAFINIAAVARFCINTERNILVLASGWKDRVNTEDLLFGGALAELLTNHSYRPASDAARMALDMWNMYKPNLRMYIEKTDHYSRLQALNLDNSVDYCLSMNLPAADGIVPILDTKTGDDASLILHR